MAKAATTSAAPVGKKKKKAAPRVAVRVKVKKIAKSAKGAKGAKKTKKAGGAAKGGFESLAKLVDHPMVADLLAAGALAAVTVIAERQLAKGKHSTSSKMVKDAGKAAASAIGKKLMDEFGAVAGAATKAAKKA